MATESHTEGLHVHSSTPFTPCMEAIPCLVHSTYHENWNNSESDRAFISLYKYADMDIKKVAYINKLLLTNPHYVYGATSLQGLFDLRNGLLGSKPMH
jgi:hypothetical protein